MFAVRGESDDRGASMRYLDRVVPVTAELLALAEPVDPRQVFRFGGPCAEGGCRHFDGQQCGLGGQVATELDPVVDTLPRCHLRGSCRWFAERGGAACLRCPVVVTMRVAADDAYVHAVQPRGETPTHDEVNHDHVHRE
ncbi:nitrogen fixation protein [Jatrophihabitans sp. YIM 134969]